MSELRQGPGGMRPIVVTGGTLDLGVGLPMQLFSGGYQLRSKQQAEDFPEGPGTRVCCTLALEGSVYRYLESFGIYICICIYIYTYTYTVMHACMHPSIH